MFDNSWYKELAVYQIYPRSFCDSNGDGIGDIKGIISKLDYIKSLGVNAIWFSPLYASPNCDFGYDISDYRTINPEYGTMSDFDELLKGIHNRGMKLIMDLVVNHTSDKHKWFEESRKSKDNPYRDYYIWKNGKGKKPPNNWTSFFTGSAWKYDKTTNEWYLHLFDENQPDLNYFNPKVKEEVKDILKFWLNKGVDGFRCDVITLLSKTPNLPNGKFNIALTGKEHFINGPEIHNILKEFKSVLDTYNCFTVGESVFINTENALRYTTEGKDQELNMLFSFEHMNADNHFGIKYFVKKFNLRQFKQSLGQWQTQLYKKSWNTLYLENHDQPRCVGRFCSDKIFVTEGSKMLATMYLCLSGTPFIYQGQEIGMQNIRFDNMNDYVDVESKRGYKLMTKTLHFSKKEALRRIKYISRDNARTPFQWNNTENAGFSNGKTWIKVNKNYNTINLASAEKDSTSVLHHYRKLLKLRQNSKLLIYGSYTEFYPKSKKLYVYLRELGNERAIIINNFTTKSVKFKVPEIEFKNSSLELSNYNDSARQLKDCTLRPYESLIYKIK